MARTSGEITLYGHPVSGLEPKAARERRNDIQYVHQDAYLVPLLFASDVTVNSPHAVGGGPNPEHLTPVGDDLYFVAEAWMGRFSWESLLYVLPAGSDQARLLVADDASGAKKTPTVLRIKLRYDDLDMFVERFAPNGCTFERCDFRGELFDERLQTLFASRRQSIFRECRFDGADLRFVHSAGQEYAPDAPSD